MASISNNKKPAYSVPTTPLGQATIRRKLNIRDSASAKNKDQPSGGAGGGNPHAGETYNAGTRNAPVTPFLTPEQMAEYALNGSKFREHLRELGYQFDELSANSAYEKAQIAKGKVQDTASAKWSLAGRGLEHSSVRDGDLYDISATAALKTQFLDDNLHAAETRRDTEIIQSGKDWEQYDAAINEEKRENAENAGANAGPWAVAPHWEKLAPVSKPKTTEPFKHNTNIPVDHSFQANSSIPGTYSHNGGTTAPTVQQQAAKAASKTRGGTRILGKTI